MAGSRPILLKFRKSIAFLVKIRLITEKLALICWQVAVDAAYNAMRKKICVVETSNDDRPLHNALKGRH